MRQREPQAVANRVVGGMLQLPVGEHTRRIAVNLDLQQQAWD